MLLRDEQTPFNLENVNFAETIFQLTKAAEPNHQVGDPVFKVQQEIMMEIFESEELYATHLNLTVAV